MSNIKETEAVTVNEVARTIPCECETGIQILIGHNSNSNTYNYYCSNCDSYSYISNTNQS